MRDQDILSFNIKNLRIKLGYTQEFIAEYLNLSSAAVSQYENNSRNIPAPVITKLALLYNIQEFELFESNPDKQNLIPAFAFRADKLNPTDMQVISKFKKIIFNYLSMDSGL